MLVLHVTYEVKEGMREVFLKKLAELQVAEKTRAEQGNRDYTYYLPADGSNRIFLAEVWESRELQAAHMKSDHIQALAAIKNDYVDRTELLAFDGAEQITL